MLKGGQAPTVSISRLEIPYSRGNADTTSFGLVGAMKMDRFHTEDSKMI